MAKHIVSIEDAPSGTWTKVKNHLDSTEADWSYEKPEFAIFGDQAVLDGVLAIEGTVLVEQGGPQPGEVAEVIEPAPPAEEPKKKKKKLVRRLKKAEAPTWLVVGEDTEIEVCSHEVPPAAVLGQRLGVATCTILDAAGEAVDTWRA